MGVESSYEPNCGGFWPFLISREDPKHFFPLAFAKHFSNRNSTLQMDFQPERIYNPSRNLWLEATWPFFLLEMDLSSLPSSKSGLI